ncbi:Retroelement silencing factor 1 [Apodemus speciosus]|uniref:Retroelement silencing factor 1 n=1 Tax=Apodemus speciosus TaxID=105296 RepID=A0ABQ0EWM9_APOSI
MTSTAPQSSFSYPAYNQEACMYSSNSNSVSQPLPSGRNYITPQTQISVSNMPSRTIVASQSSLERVVSTNVKGPQQPNHNLQTMSSGVMQNVWLGSSMKNFMPSHTEATVSHNPDGGTNMPYMHPPQSQLVTSDTYSMQLQMVPLNSGKVPITHHGNQGLNHFIPDQLADWTQYTSNELTYPEYRPPPKQYSYILPATTSLQVKNNQLPTYAQSLQSKYAAETSKRPSALPYSCRYGNQHMQNAQPVSKHLPMEVPQSSEVHSSEKKKDTYRDFKQQWQNANEKSVTIGQFCDLKINTKQSYSEPVRSSGDGVQALVQNNQEKRKYSYNASTNQVIDTNATKEKLARDIKSLVEIKKKFSELARKIKINKSLLMAAGCSKTANTSYTEPIQHSEFSAKEMSAKNGNDCSMELLATCLSLWKNQPSKTTEENVLKPLEEKQCNTSRITTVVGSSNPTSEVHVKSFCSSVGNSQKIMSSSQTVLPVLTPSCESSGVAVGKGTELQIAVVSPLVLSDTNTLPEKELVPEVVPETLYPVVKEGSVCSLQNQQAETIALSFDIIGAVADNKLSAEISLPVDKEKQHKPTQGDADIADSSLGKHSPLGVEVLPKPEDSTTVSGSMLQIESICSLAEGDVSYNSQIAEIFNSVQNEPQKPSHNQVVNSQQEQVYDTTENKDFSFQKDKCVQCADVPHEVTEHPEPLQPKEPASREYVETNRETVEESQRECTGGKESTAKDVCSPTVVPQDPHPQETDMLSNKSAHSLPAINEINDESEPISYLHDQLSELLKEFPYGIETVTRHEVSVDRQKTHKILGNQTSGKASNMFGDSTNQIKITVLNSEQIKELFPEEDPPCHKLAEPENKEIVAEVKSPGDSQVPREESHEFGMLDPEKDKIHCCALGWLSMVYEGVPQCRCSSTEEKGKDQCLDINSSKQREQPYNSGITIFEISPVSNNPKTLTQAAEKSHFSEMHGEKTKASKTKDTREEQELTCNFSAKSYKKDKNVNFNIRHDSSLKMEQKLKGISSKCDIPNSSKSNKIATPEILHVTTSNSDKNTPFSKQASQESLQKKTICQDSGPVKAPVELSSNTCRRDTSLVQSVSPEKKKLKFKAGGSRLKYFEKRKTDHVIPDVEIKKKKYEKQEQNKNAGDTLKLCSSLIESNERASVQEKTVPSPESSDSKVSSSKSTRVMTVQEYLQRQKDKHVTGNNVSTNMCVESVLCDSEHTKTSKHSAAVRWGKLVEGQSISAETSKELENNSTSLGKNFKIHYSEASRPHSVSSNSKRKFDGKQPDKTCNSKTSLSNESNQMPLQVKEQRKQYLNRVAFKCTERESICLSKLDSASMKLSTEKKSGAYTPKTKDIDKPSMLEFKLCPDVLLKNTCSDDKPDDPGPEKEQAPVQDSADSRLSKRSLSADEFEMLQNPVKDSNAMFRTYKKMYLEKRSRSLGSSPVK